jgi:hypothetical protein
VSSSYAQSALLALQHAMTAAIKGSAGVQAVLGNPARIYDQVPAMPSFPYASFGPFQALDNGDQCLNGAEIFVQVDVWSRAVGRVEALTIAAVLAPLLDADLTITGHEVVVHELEGLTTQTGADGLTTQAILRLRYEVVAASD